jgi:YVTN family beta-propeller protein
MCRLHRFFDARQPAWTSLGALLTGKQSIAPQAIRPLRAGLDSSDRAPPASLMPDAFQQRLIRSYTWRASIRSRFHFVIGLGLLALPMSLALAAPFAYITNFASNNVSVIDTAINTVVATVPVGSSPFGVAVNFAGTRAYVTDSTGVSVIDAATNAVIAVIAATGGRGIAVNQAGTRVYTATVLPFPGVAVIDAATNTVVTKVVTSDVCWGVAVNPAGTRVYATNEFANTVSVIDTATNSLITAVTVGLQPQGVVVNPAGTRVYVTNINDHTISVIDTATNTVIATVPSANVDLGIAVDPTGIRVYVTNSPSNISVLDTATNTIVATPGLGFNSGPQGIAVTPDGKWVYVVNLQSDNVSVIDAATNAMVAIVTVGSRPVAFGQFIGPVAPAPSSQAVLENPQPGSFQSGVGLLSGWSCQGPSIGIAIDGAAPANAPYGSSRADTAGVCGATNINTGFGLLINFNLFGPGPHSAQMFVNGQPQGSPTQFTVAVPAGEFLTGAVKQVTVTDFPTPGKTTVLMWQQSQQNFAIKSVGP